MHRVRSYFPWVVLVATLLLIGLLEVRRLPPRPLGSDAPPDEFSAARAREVLADLLADGAPHATGTAEADAVRERIVQQLDSLGIPSEVQETLACRSSKRTASVACAQVKNVLARLPGTEDGSAHDGRAVLLMAHYDSVNAGPGASDDGAGVAAVLEIARILKQEPPRLRPVILLLDDAEEAGLFGAQGFVDDHPWAKDVGVVVNIEARGTTGQSLLFQMSDDDAWLLDAYRGTPYPATSSLYAEVYRRLPNDTDLSIFLERGYAGVNFAYAEGEPRYHSAIDDLEHLDLGSLQHHGDNALAMVRSLADDPRVGSPPPGRAVFTDIAGWFVVSYPVARAVPVATLVLLAWLVVTIATVRRGDAKLSRFAAGWAVSVLVLVITVVGAHLLGLLMQALTGSSDPAYAQPVALRVAVWTLVFLVAGLLAAAASRLVAAPVLFLGVWSFVAVLGVVAASLAPGVSHFFVLPAALAGLCFAAGQRFPSRRQGFWLTAALGQAFFWFAIARSLELGLGFQTIVVAAPLALAALPFLPLFAHEDAGLKRQRAFYGVLAGIFVVSLLVATQAEPFTDDAPQQVRVIAFHDLAASPPEARLLIDAAGAGVPADMREKHDISEERALGPAHFFRRDVFEGPEIKVADAAQAPSVEILGVEEIEGGCRYQGSLRTQGADVVRLGIPATAGLSRVQIGGKTLELKPDADWFDMRLISCIGSDCDGVEFGFDLTTCDAVDVEALATSYRLPPAGLELAASRPSWTTPRHSGDLTLVRSVIHIQPPASEPPRM